MPRIKYKQAARQGGIDVELPLTTLQNCYDLPTGQVLHLLGTAQAQSVALSEDISVTMKKNEKSLCFQLLASSMGSVFKKKLMDKWTCILVDAQVDETRSQSSSSAVKSNKRTRSSQHRKSQDHTKHAKKKNEIVQEQCSLDLEISLVKSEASVIETEFEPAEKVPKLDSNCAPSNNPEGCAVIQDEIVRLSSAVLGEMESEAVSEDFQVKQEWDQTGGGDLNQEQIIAKDWVNNKVHDVNNFVDRDNVGDTSDIWCDNDAKELEEDAEQTGVVDMLQSVRCLFCNKNYSGMADPQNALEKHLLRKCTQNPWSRDTVAPEPTVSEKYCYQCEYCPKAFEAKKRLNTHLHKCARNPNYMAQFDKNALNLTICELCDRMFANEKALKSHKVVVHAFTRARDIPTKYECRYCQVPFNCRGTRYHHETFKCSMNPNVAQLSYCRLCDRKLPKEKLDEHMAECHTVDEERVCEICGAIFPSNRRLYTHMYIHKVKIAKHSCQICKRMFKMKNQLERHLTTHTEERNVQCPVCGKFFKNKDQERDHRQFVHEGRYKYRCDKCGHGMAKKVYLVNHKCGRVRRVQDGETFVNSETKMEEKDNVKLDEVQKVELKEVYEKPPEVPDNNGIQHQHDNIVLEASSASYFVMSDNMIPNVMPVNMASQEQQITHQLLVSQPQYNNYPMQPVQPTVQPTIQHSIQHNMHQTMQPAIQSNIQY